MPSTFFSQMIVDSEVIVEVFIAAYHRIHSHLKRHLFHGLALLDEAGHHKPLLQAHACTHLRYVRERPDKTPFDSQPSVATNINIFPLMALES
jgi:hypothetical protein